MFPAKTGWESWGCSTQRRSHSNLPVSEGGLQASQRDSLSGTVVVEQGPVGTN